MKIWLLKPTPAGEKALEKLAPLEMSIAGKFVVVAFSEEAARLQASYESGDERGMFWRSRKTATCEELVADDYKRELAVVIAREPRT
jgi:hypothetical protein